MPLTMFCASVLVLLVWLVVAERISFAEPPIVTLTLLTETLLLLVPALVTVMVAPLFVSETVSVVVAVEARR